MTVGELKALLEKWPEKSVVLVRLDGSVFSTDDGQAHTDYNDLATQESDEPEFFILADEDI